MARSWPSLSACALGEGSAGAGSAGGRAGAAAGFRCRRVRRFAPREETWGLPALQSSSGRELFLGRADPNRQNGPPLGWLRYYCRARSEEKQGQAEGGKEASTSPRPWRSLASAAELAGSRSGCAFGDPLVTLEGWLAFVYSLF